MHESIILDTKYIAREIITSYFYMFSNVPFSPIFEWVIGERMNSTTNYRSTIFKKILQREDRIAVDEADGD